MLDLDVCCREDIVGDLTLLEATKIGFGIFTVVKITTMKAGRYWVE